MLPAVIERKLASKNPSRKFRSNASAKCRTLISKVLYPLRNIIPGQWRNECNPFNISGGYTTLVVVGSRPVSKDIIDPDVFALFTKLFSDISNSLEIERKKGVVSRSYP